MTDFRLPTEDELTWPSGDAQVVALLTLRADELEERVGLPLRSGVEEGLGPWKGIGLILASGRPIELVWHEAAADRSAPTELRVDVDDDYFSARDEAIAALRLVPSEIAWVLPYRSS